MNKLKTGETLLAAIGIALGATVIVIAIDIMTNGAISNLVNRTRPVDEETSTDDAA